VRVGVVGHVEWVEFLRVERVPAAGEIALAQEAWSEAAGGGAVAAAELVRLAGETIFFTALGADDIGRLARAQLDGLGIKLKAAVETAPTRRGICFIDESGERTITVVGRKLVASGANADLPWEELAGADGVYFTGGDVAAARQARRARVLVATARELPTLVQAGIEVDALVASGGDEGERYEPGSLDPPPRIVVTTAGQLGGWAQPGGPYRAAPLPGPVEDAYGAGDCFAAGLTFGLASGATAEEALELAAQRGAAALTRRGAHGLGT